MAGARDFLEGGHLFRIELTDNRRGVDTDDPRLADRVANVAVPETENSPEYEAFRKLQIYHTALEGAYSDGRVTRKDRVILDGLRRTLGIGDADAQRVEDDMRKVAQLARRDLHTQQPAGPAGT
jgi:hypothetical protein